MKRKNNIRYLTIARNVLTVKPYKGLKQKGKSSINVSK